MGRGETPIHDLHAHSRHSDGTLNPGELVDRAAEHGVSVLALTDHDSTDGLEHGLRAGKAAGIRFIPGVEISVTWQNKTVHIVGLNIDPADPVLARGLACLQTLRTERAERMEDRLQDHGIDIGPTARRLAGDGTLTRSHFARALVEAGHVNTLQKAFKRWLAPGKPGYVSTCWATLEDSVNWIRHAGGSAVIAHPMRYRWTNSWRSRLFRDFKSAGGDGAEVVGSGLRPDVIRAAAALATTHGLMGSTGSDFHSPEYPWIELGRLAPLPDGVQPIWSKWR